AVMVDPARRADPTQRASATSVFHKACDAGIPLADVAMAGMLFLEKSDFEWGLSSDLLTVKGPSGETKFAGRLEKRSDTVSMLILADRREVRIRTAGSDTFITPPGAAEFKATEVKTSAGQTSEALEALQAFFKGVDAAKFETLEDKEISEGVKFLALKVKELRTKNQPVAALSLFVAGPASA